jgi:type I restriction enzyme S subunit
LTSVPQLFTLSDAAGRNGFVCDGDWVESKDQDPNGDVRLIQLADIGTGNYLNKSNRRMTTEATLRLRCTFLKPGDILIARMPDPIGRACIFPGDASPCVTVVDVCVLRADDSIAYPQYVVHMLNAPPFLQSINTFVKGTTRQRIARTSLEALSFPYVTIEEQRRIAAILDEADELRRKRRLALALLTTLKESAYNAVRLQPGAEDWPRVKIGDIASLIRTGPFGSQLLHSEFVDEGVAVLGIDNTLNNEFSWSQRRFIAPNKYKELQRYTVYPGDVLITIMGTCGRCAIVPETIPLAINTKHLCCITLDPLKCLPELLHAALIFDSDILAQLGVRERGAVMPGLNMQLIKETSLRLPPLAMQARFVNGVKQIRALELIQRNQLHQLDQLFNSLQHHAFEGTLTSSVEATFASV